eukprot:4761767-Amphidinium_carterae.1
MHGFVVGSYGYAPYAGTRSKRAAKPAPLLHTAHGRGYAPGRTEDRELQAHIAASSSVAYFPTMPPRQPTSWVPIRTNKGERVYTTPATVPT